MSNIAFSDVTGFNLKWPSRHWTRPERSLQGEWIVFNKEKNKLPTATLRTWVLYYRYNGDSSGNDINLSTDNLDLGAWGDGQPNFRFYNNYVDVQTDASGGQLGSIWGFPLFNVGNTATNWPRFNSCITNSTINPINGLEDISGNERMLVNLNNRNILILDFSGYDDDNTRDAFKDISNNLQPYVNGGFYVTLRIKSSSESLVFGKHSDQNARVGSHFYAWKRAFPFGTWTVQKKKFCTLVEYKFECDIIGPKPMLDLSLDYFSYYTNIGCLFGKDSSWDTNKFLVKPTATTVATANAISVSNKYTTDISINIITGTKYDNSKDTRMDTKYIYDHFTIEHLANTDWREAVIAKDYYWSTSGTHSGYSITKLIGGSSQELVRTDISGGGGYYGSNYGTEWNNTNKSNIIGWRWDIDLSANSNLNKWPGDNNNKNYDLNNILWCSLRSPKKVKMRRIDQLNSETSRFITNFIDISGTYSVGGGYGRYTNTLDMPRSSALPYYDSSGNSCVTINDYVLNNNNAQYLDASNSKIPGPVAGTTVSEFNRVRTLDEIGHYIIYYKLLIPPKSGTCSITYTFGKNTNPESNVTFFRYNDMSGNPSPQGKYNYNAIRDTESIQLNWINNNTEINSLVLTDIASGFSKYTADISFEDLSLNKTRDTITEDYDISCNVFQIIFNSVNDSDNIDERYENPYSIKIFDSNSQNKQFYDISYIPLNYIPYRYIDSDKLSINSGTSCEKEYYWEKAYTQPLLIKNETFNYNTIKVYPRKAGNYILTQQPPIFNEDTNPGAAENASQLPRAVIIAPEAERIVDTINFNINTINDASFSVISEYNLSDSINQLLSQEEIAIFTKNNTKNILSLLNENISVQVSTENSPAANIIFSAPYSLFERNNFIPDYWRLQDKVNIVRKNNQTGIISYDTNYGYFAKWSNQIQTTALFDILSVILKGDESDNIAAKREVAALLVNSNKNSLEWSAVDVDGGLITGNIIFNVQGATGLPPGATLAERPVVVQLITLSTGPFGSTTVNYIGDTGGSTNSGIKSANYNVNTVLPNTMRQGNNNGNNFPNTNEKSYNGLYDIFMSGWNEIPVLSNPRQNPYFNDAAISPSPLKVLLVDISNVVQTNGKDPTDMISTGNKSVTIKWSGFYFSNDISWNLFPIGQDGNIEWIISRYNIATGLTKTMYTGTVPYNLSTKEYSWSDDSVNVYDKYTWTVKGNYKWYGITKIIPGAKIPSISVPGFTTPQCFICKFNRFQYGRYNTTSTNLKLFAPLKINLPEGQVNQFGNKVCGGGCSDPKNPSLRLFTGSTGISSSNNIYANTTNQLSKKQTYVLLAKSRFRPSR